MAYSTPKTMGNEPTIYSDWNTYVRDNFAETAPGKFTTKGDLIAATGANATARLGAGADYWGLAYRAGATPGIAVAPQRTILQSSGYANYVNTAAEQTLLTLTIPGGFLSTNQMIRFRLWMWVINNKGTSGTIDVKAYYGATALANNFGNQKTFHSTANPSTFFMDSIVAGYGATNSQKGMMWATLYEASGPSQYQGMQAPISFAIDSTADQTAKITAQMSAASASFQFSVLQASIEACPIGTMG